MLEPPNNNPVTKFKKLALAEVNKEKAVRKNFFLPESYSDKLDIWLINNKYKTFTAWIKEQVEKVIGEQQG